MRERERERERVNESLHDDKRNFGIQREKEGERENLSRKVRVNNRQHCECEKETLCVLKNRERERCLTSLRT